MFSAKELVDLIEAELRCPVNGKHIFFKGRNIPVSLYEEVIKRGGKAHKKLAEFSKYDVAVLDKFNDEYLTYLKKDSLIIKFGCKKTKSKTFQGFKTIEILFLG